MRLQSKTGDLSNQQIKKKKKRIELKSVQGPKEVLSSVS